MANLPISGLTASASNLASTDLAPVVQTVGVGPVKMTGLQLAGGLLGSTTFNGSTVTTSSPVLNLTQTWNAGAVTFTGLKFNATDTASASGSLLLDLQVGNASKVSFLKDGGALCYGLRVGTASSNTIDVGYSTTAVVLANNFSLSWYSQSNLTTGGSRDLHLTRAAAATLQLGAADAAAPVAQTFKVQSGTAGASATTVSISGTSLTIAGTVTGTIAIGHAVTGTGVSAGTLITAGSGTSWTVNNSQTVGPITAYFNSVGANFTIRGSQGSGPSAGGSLIFQVAPAGSAATTAQNAYATALTIASDKKVQTENNITVKGSLYCYGGGANLVISGENNGLGLQSGQPLRWGSAASYDGTFDTYLYRDTTSTLALRNGNSTGAAQRFNVYNTYTSSTNYETFKIDWITAANNCLIGTEKGSGGGTARALTLQTDGTTRASWAANGVLTFNGNASYTIDQFNNFNWGFNQITGTGMTANVLAIGTGSGLPILLRDASYTLGLRDGNNGQIFNVYGRYTSSTNFERWFVEVPTTSAATVLIGTQKGSGGGSARALELQTDATTRLTLTTLGSVVVNTAALNTTATDGFLYVPTCAGTPTGTPTTQTGTAPIVVDTTNNKLYFYSGGQWRDAGP